MVPSQKVVSGVSRYLDNEILPHLTPVKALMAGTVVTLYLGQIPVILGKLPGITDDENNVDIEALRNAVLQNMKDSVPVVIPMIGSITFDRAEVDKLYRYIVE